MTHGSDGFPRLSVTLRPNLSISFGGLRCVCFILCGVFYAFRKSRLRTALSEREEVKGDLYVPFKY